MNFAVSASKILDFARAARVKCDCVDLAQCIVLSEIFHTKVAQTREKFERCARNSKGASNLHTVVISSLEEPVRQSYRKMHETACTDSYSSEDLSPD